MSPDKNNFKQNLSSYIPGVTIIKEQMEKQSFEIGIISLL